MEPDWKRREHFGLANDRSRPDRYGCRVCREATYRFGLCTGLVRLLRPWGTIVVSGTIFGALHVLYGNPGPDNLIAGYFLAWTYLKSGTIIVPVVLHSLGNLCGLVMHFAT
jgi:membrane protease YdiL (CAAX protease family)